MSDIIFRRVRGHIVPIKVDRKELTKGASAVVAGGAVAASGGKLFNKLEGYVYRAHQRSMNAYHHFKPKIAKGTQMTFDDLLRQQSAERIATKFLQKPKFAAKAMPFVRHAAIGVGASLIGYGSAKVAKSLSKDKENVGQQVSAAVAGATATAIFAGAFKPRMALKLFMKVLKR